jgi:hypothetical protein
MGDCFRSLYIYPEHIDKQVGMFTNEEMMMATCFICGDGYPDERKMLGYRVCLFCGHDMAKAESLRKQSMVQPINKSTPTYIADFTLLKQLNPKRTT